MQILAKYSWSETSYFFTLNIVAYNVADISIHINLLAISMYHFTDYLLMSSSLLASQLIGICLDSNRQGTYSVRQAGLEEVKLKLFEVVLVTY